MTVLKTKPYPGEIREDFVVSAVCALEYVAQEGSFGRRPRLVVHGPIPIYTGSSEQVALNGPGRSARHVGWRSLIFHRSRPMATVQRGLPGRGAGLIVRGPPAVEAMAAAMSEAERHMADHGLRADRFEIRYLLLTDSYVSALWFKGRASFFIPTRLGGHSVRPHRCLSQAELSSAIKRAMRVRMPNRRNSKRS